ncbi:hypothetical protein LWI28_029122 [Acer negundo]|uniref:Uncharacterized protein n=1 Tax=Acer negundo TaxID=4023 RepID=A0AAD5NTK2_ACENE|nr:hypothetical protein LWI28_029122 [Acer negundo]
MSAKRILQHRVVAVGSWAFTIHRNYLRRKNYLLTRDGRYQRAVAWDMLRVYSDFVDAQERLMIERLELFDEFEEWHMIQASKSPIPVIESVKMV